MPAMDFPNTPATGETFGSLGTVWRWDGTRWLSTSGPSGPRGIVAYAQVTTQQSGITTIVDLTGMSVSWTADPSRVYRTSYYAGALSTVSNDWALFKIRNAANVALQTQVPPILSAVYGQQFTGNVVETGLSGTQTRKLSMERLAGTGSLSFNVGVTQPGYIMVEDITYEAGNSGSSGPWPLGRIAYTQRLSNITGLTTVVSLTDLSLNASLIGGRAYRLSCEVYVNSTVATDRIGLEIRRNAVQIQSVQANAIATYDTKAYASLVYRPSVNETSTFAIYGGRIGGSGTVSVIAGATFPAYLLVEDIGIA